MIDQLTDIIFEIIDKTGRKIRLTKKQWSHINKKHPNVDNHYDLEETITKPIKILYLEKNKVVFYRYFKNRKFPEKYLKVIVRYLNGKGFIITAYYIPYIK